MIVVAFLLLFVFGEGMPPITILHVCFPFGVILGLVLAWFFEGIGATVTIVSIAAFYSIHYLHAGRLPGGPFFLISGIPSVFFLVSWLMRKDMTTRTDAEPAHSADGDDVGTDAQRCG